MQKMETIEIRSMTAEDVPQAAMIEKQNFTLPWEEKSFVQALEKKENYGVRLEHRDIDKDPVTKRK